MVHSIFTILWVCRRAYSVRSDRC